MKKVFFVACLCLCVLSAAPVMAQQKNAARMNFEKTKTLVGYPGEVLSMAFSPDGKTMVIGTSDKKLVLFSVPDWQTINTIDQNGRDVTAVAFSPDGNYLASGDKDKKVFIFDTKTWKVVQKVKTYDDVSALAFNYDGSLLAIASGKKDSAMLWDVKKDALAKKLKSRYGDVQAIAMSPDGSQVAGGTQDNKIVLWDAATGNEIMSLSGHSSNVEAITYSPDGKYLVSGGADNVVMTWDAKTGAFLNRLMGHADRISSLAFIPNTTTLASADCKIFLGPFFRKSRVGGPGCKAIFWDVATAKQLKTIDTDCSLTSIALSPDGKFFVTGHATGSGQFITVYEKK
jgi:WD40 repeat protein